MDFVCAPKQQDASLAKLENAPGIAYLTLKMKIFFSVMTHPNSVQKESTTKAAEWQHLNTGALGLGRCLSASAFSWLL